MVRIITGNIFTTECNTIVNTVNCVGVMGAGIALEYRLRYPEMYTKYVDLCKARRIDIGMLWLYKSDDKWILNFPTKKHWKYPSKKEYLHAGLQKFVKSYQTKEINSIAFPLLGADRGGIDPDASLEIMRSYLDDIPINIEIYLYDQMAKDDLFDKTKEWLLSSNIESIAKSTGLSRTYIDKLCKAMQSENIVQLNQLANVKGIGITTLEKIYSAARQLSKLETENEINIQSPLDF